MQRVDKKNSIPAAYTTECHLDGDSFFAVLARDDCAVPQRLADQTEILDNFNVSSGESLKPHKMPWGYKEANGPHTWVTEFPDAAGNGQSPVDIATSDAIYDSDISTHPLKISYAEEDNFEVTNTGSSFKVDITKPSEIQGGPLKDCYRLEQFHLHWGSSDDHGSEHTINGHSYAAELHLVHWNCSKYTSFADAVNKHDGLAVLGIMIECGSEHKGFKDLTDVMRSVQAKGKTCKVLSQFQPACLLPGNTKEFWTYHGSLTTPPCYESVQWVVLRQPVQYSPSQLKALRSLLNSENGDECIVDNFRPPLPLGDRKIRASFQAADVTA